MCGKALRGKTFEQALRGGPDGRALHDGIAHYTARLCPPDSGILARRVVKFGPMDCCCSIQCGWGETDKTHLGDRRRSIVRSCCTDRDGFGCCADCHLNDTSPRSLKKCGSSYCSHDLALRTMGRSYLSSCSTHKGGVHHLPTSTRNSGLGQRLEPLQVSLG